jgi:hypothetical protein
MGARPSGHLRWLGLTPRLTAESAADVTTSKHSIPFCCRVAIRAAGGGRGCGIPHPRHELGAHPLTARGVSELVDAVGRDGVVEGAGDVGFQVAFAARASFIVGGQAGGAAGQFRARTCPARSPRVIRPAGEASQGRCLMPLMKLDSRRSGSPGRVLVARPRKCLGDLVRVVLRSGGPLDPGLVPRPGLHKLMGTIR